eukprot:3385556-Karenia_brevis.AAC.1
MVDTSFQLMRHVTKASARDLYEHVEAMLVQCSSMDVEQTATPPALFDEIADTPRERQSVVSALEDTAE